MKKYILFLTMSLGFLISASAQNISVENTYSNRLKITEGSSVKTYDKAGCIVETDGAYINLTWNNGREYRALLYSRIIVPTHSSITTCRDKIDSLLAIRTSSDSSMTTIKSQLAKISADIVLLKAKHVSNVSSDTSLTLIKAQLAYLENKLNSLAGHFVSNGATDSAITTIKGQVAYMQNKLSAISTNTSNTSSGLSSLNTKSTTAISGDSATVITTSTTTNLLSAGSPVTVMCVDIGTSGSGNILTFYNNSTAAGAQKIAPILCTQPLVHTMGTRGVAFPNGCTIVSASGTPGKYTIVWRPGVN